MGLDVCRRYKEREGGGKERQKERGGEIERKKRIEKVTKRLCQPVHTFIFACFLLIPNLSLTRFFFNVPIFQVHGVLNEATQKDVGLLFIQYLTWPIIRHNRTISTINYSLIIKV